MSKEIVLGEIVKPHGVRGAVKVRSYADSPESFLKMKKITILPGNCKKKDTNDVNISLSNTENSFIVEKAGGMGGKVILKFRGLDSREDAEALVGSVITVVREDLPETEEGEYYWEDLIGMEVYDISGKYLGIIKSILQTGSNDVYVVEGAGAKTDKDKGEILIPGTYDAVREIDVAGKKMIVEPDFGPVFNVEN